MNSYEDRLLRVIAYIQADPAGDMSLDRLADVAALSRFHFARVFRAVTGRTVSETVRRIRMGRAAVALCYSSRPIAEIAASVGYSDVTSFTRAFAETCGLPPGAFREKGQYRPEYVTLRTGEPDMTHTETPTNPDPAPVSIREMDSRRLAALEHVGPYSETGEVLTELGTLLAARGLMQKAGAMVCLYHDDPDNVPAEKLRMHAGYELPEGEVAPPLEEIVLPAGRYAVMRHTGPYSSLHLAYRAFFGVWLPQSGVEPGDSPCFETYLNDPADTPPDQLVTEIWMPLK
ncbi:MAG: AraC family transcriptional regulator [Rhodobacterales bacterium]|nr:MAG: AraC family transcriptional regulator [Rhodobacterales bacterium]